MLLFEMPGNRFMLILGMLTALLAALLIFYLVTLNTTLDRISEENRTMSPGSVWLLLIPFFNLVWHFIVVGRLADSIKAEADHRGLTLNESRPAYDIGLVMCILLIVLPFIGFICWIVYWVKINGYKNLLRPINTPPVSA